MLRCQPDALFLPWSATLSHRNSHLPSLRFFFSLHTGTGRSSVGTVVLHRISATNLHGTTSSTLHPSFEENLNNVLHTHTQIEFGSGRRHTSIYPAIRRHRTLPRTVQQSTHPMNVLREPNLSHSDTLRGFHLVLSLHLPYTSQT